MAAACVRHLWLNILLQQYLLTNSCTIRIVHLLCVMCSGYVISTSGTDNVGDYVLTKEQNEYLTSFEKTSMEDYVRGSRHDEESQLDAIVGNISHRLLFV